MGRGRFNLLFYYGIAYLVFLYAPVLLLPMFSFNDSIYVAFPFKGFTFKWYEQMAASAGLTSAFWNSVKVGTGVAVVSTIFGLLGAKAVTRYRLPWSGPVTGMIMLPLVIPGIVIGVALLSIIRKVFDLELSLLTISAGHVLVCTPFAMMVLMSRLEGFDKSLEEASLDLGENGWRTFWRVTFPLALPGIVASLLLCFTTSFDEFILAFFLAGNEVTLPIYIWGQLRFPNRLPATLALGSCILLGSFVIVTFSEWLRRRGAKSALPAGL